MPDIDVLIKSTSIGIPEIDNTTKAYIDLEKGISATSEEMKEAEKIQRKYGVSLKGAQEIMRRTHPEIREIERIQKDLNVSTAEATKIYNASSKQMTSANMSMKSMIKTMVGTGVVLLAAKKAWDFTKESIGLASDAVEEHTKLQTVFSGMIEQSGAAVKELTDNYGFSTLQAERMFAATGDLLAGFGFSEKAMFDLSLQTQKMAADLASFTNIEGGAARASAALTKLLVGETEPAKQLGIVVRQDTKEFKDMVKELQRSQGATLLQAKAMTSLNIAVKQSQLAMGDFGRTQDSFANQSRILQATVEDLKVEFGRVFVEALLPALQNLSSWMKENKDLIVSGFQAIGKGVEFALGPLTAVGLASQIVKNEEAITESTKTLVDTVEESIVRLSDFRNTIDGTIVDTSKFSEAIQMFSQSSGDANQQFAELNAIWADIKSGEYGEEIAKQFAVFNAEFVKTIEAQNKGAESTNNLNQELTASQKIAEQYRVSLTSANEILKAMNPEVGGAEKLQKKLKVSQEEATKVLGILNSIEKDRKENLKATKEELREVPELQELVNSQTLIAIDLVPKLNEWQTETNEGLREAKAGLEEKARASIIAESAAAALAREEAQLAKNLKLVTQALDILSGLSFVPDKLASGFSAIGTAAQQIVSGDWLGLIGTGVNFIADMFGGGDGVTGQVEVATAALEEFGVTGEEAIKKLSDAYEDLLSSMSMSELLDMTAEDWESTMDDMADMAEEVAKSTREFYEPIRDAIPDLEKFLAVPAKNAADFNAQATITLGTFANMLKSGLSITQALAEMDGAFDKLITSQDALGIEGNKAFEALKEFRTLIKDNQELVDSVEGLNAVIEATAALGALSQEQMDAFGASAQQKFEDLTAAGFNNQQALSLIGPTLLQLKENAELYGTELDANTQKLIAQAEESGVFNEMADPLDTIASILEQIFFQLGGTEDALASFGNTAAANTTATTQGLEEVDANIMKIGDDALNTADKMADSMGAATDSISGDIMNMENESLKSFNNLAADANQAAIDMANGFKEASSDSLESIKGFASLAGKELGGLGGNNGLRTQPPLLQGRPDIPRAANGINGIVPPGFNDNYFVAAKSGEEVNIKTPGQQAATRSGDVKVNVTIVGGDKYEMARNFIDAYQSNLLEMRTKTTG
jgi:hypothetical protein